MARGPALALAASLLLFGVTACASPEELRRQDAAACASYGFQPGTPEFAACVQRESIARRYGGGTGLSLGLGFGVGL